MTTLDATNLGNRSSLGRSLGVAAQTLVLAPGGGWFFRVPPGRHTYATLRGAGGLERVKVLSQAGDTISVQRGVDGTAAKMWPAGTCVSIEPSPALLCELWQQCSGGTLAPATVNPGTYCLTGCTCIEVGADGRILSINQQSGCA